MSAAKAVAGARLLLGIAVMMSALETAGVMFRIESGRLAMPSVFGAVPVTASTIGTWTLVTMLSGLLIACGALTRPAMLVAASLCGFAILWDQQGYSNHQWLLTLLLVFTSFARSDSVWSVRAVSLRRPPAAPHPLPLLLMATQISVCYVFGALAKVNQWWLAGDALELHTRLDLPGQAYPLLAALVIVTELFIGLGMWFRQTRLLALATGAALHISIVAFMYDPFPLSAFALMCLAIYPVVLKVPYAPEIFAELRGDASTRGEVARGAPTPH